MNGTRRRFAFENCWSKCNSVGHNAITFDAIGQDATYDFHANGNRDETTEPGGGTDTYTTIADNRLSEDSTYSYSYDDEGNLIERTRLSDGDRENFFWDHRNRLVRVTKTSNDHEWLHIDYRYDAAGDLVYRSDTPADIGPEGAEIEHYVVENGQRTMTLDSGGDVVCRYLYGPTREVLFD